MRKSIVAELSGRTTLNTSPEFRKAPVSLSPGQIFEGRFEIISLLGEGGMGMVYKARQTHMNKFVAIKTLNLSPGSGDIEAFLRFEKEAQAASSFSHPNVVAIYDFGKTEGGLAYLVMEYLDGKSLEDVLLEQGPLSPDLFLQVATQTCEALQHAHKHGVVHRDIKPSNIMLVNTGEAQNIVKLVDFGMAKLTDVDNVQHLTKTGTIVGTPLFMSPEQCRGMELDWRSDIYSLGCVLYTALTGKVPLIGNTTLDTLYKHASVLPQPFSIVAPSLNLPFSLEQVIFKSLQKDPDARQQSMLELRNEITSAVLGRSNPASSAAAAYVVPASSGAAASGSSGVAFSAVDGYSKTLEVSQGELSQPGILKENTSIHNLRVADSVIQEKFVISKSTLIVSISAVFFVFFGIVGYLWQAQQAEDKKLQEVLARKEPVAAAVQTLPPAPQLLPAHQEKPPVSAKLQPQIIEERKKEHPAQKQEIASLSGSSGGGHANSVTVPGLKKDLDKAARVKQARELEHAGNEEWTAKHFAEAEHNYQLSLQELEEVVGASDARLFFPLARLVDCQSHLIETAKARTSLNQALRVFSANGALVLQDIQRRHNQSTVWLPMAKASYDVAHETDNRTYLKWSADFYALARNGWSAATDSPQYRSLCQDYCTVLKECGDVARANQVRAELNMAPLSPVDHADRPAQAPLRRKAQIWRPHIMHFGKMEIWQR